jgi:hypothetical protein
VTLDLVKVAEQLPLMIKRVQRDRTDAHGRTAYTLAQLHRAAADPDAFERLMLDAQTSWTLALPAGEPLNAAHPPPEPPRAYSVVALDGSSIDVDRHLPVDCYVMNFGWMTIHYGDTPLAEFDSSVELQPTGEELFLRDADDPSREAAIKGAALSVVRSVRELALLADKAEELASPERPLLALVDGNLALWNLDKPDLPETIADELKYGERGTVAALNRLRRLAGDGLVLFCGFVSRTGAANVVHSLRLMVCPMGPRVVCRECPGKPGGVRPCDEAGLPNDRAIMLEILKPWERSAVFLPHSARRGGGAEAWYKLEGHEIAFFYLRVGDEIARIELPVWMAADRNRLGLLHTLLVQQAQEGGEYPVALQEAHEQAVISTSDRTYFTHLIVRELELNGIPWHTSAKALSKRLRAI